MTTEKNKWVEDVLGSAERMSRAQAPDMTGSVLSRVDQTQTSSGMMWRIAASVIILVALNVSSIIVYNSYHQSESLRHSQDAASLFGFGADSRQVDIGTVFFGN